MTDSSDTGEERETDAGDGGEAETGSRLEVLVDDYEAFTGQSLDRGDYADLKRAVRTDVVPVTDADRSFLVIGSYGDAEEDRLRLVERRLDAVGKPFLLKDLEAFDSVLLWTTQFKVMASRATHVVAVYEHSHGGHEWEAGWLDHEPYRGKLAVFKRDYPDLEPEDEPFDGMFAHFIETLTALGQTYRFDAPTDAPDDEVERGVRASVSDYEADLLDDGERNSP